MARLGGSDSTRLTRSRDVSTVLSASEIGSVVKGKATVGESGKLQLTFNSEDKAINLCYIIIKSDGEGAALPQTGIKGDVNIDGKLSAADLVTLEKYLVNEDTLTRDQWLNADINRDDSADVFDMVMLRKLLLKA